VPQAAETPREKCCRSDGDASGRRIYAYVLNDPLNLIDPYGLNWQSVVWSGVKGAAYGAAGAVVIGGAAAGAVFLGAPVAVVTGVVGVVGVVGGVYTFSSIVSNISSGNWNGLAFNAGSIVGGAGAGYALGGAAADIVNGGPSSSGWSLSGDLAMGYNPGLGSIGDWLSTGPTASSMGGAMAAGGAGAAQAAKSCAQ